MALDVSMILRLVDRFTGPGKRATAASKGLVSGLKDAGRAGGVASVGMKTAERAAGRLPSVFDRARAASRKLADLGLKGVGKAAYAAGWGIGALTRQAGKWALSAAKWGLIGGASAAAYGLGSFVTGIVTTGAKFEQFEAQLEGTEGSAQKARAALEWVMKFAKDTPYAMDEVTDAFVRARGVGIDPFTGAMTTMGDAASANRKTIMEAVEAIADAQTGEFERLKEFNITSSTKGNQVAFSFIGKDGKTAVKTVKKDMAEIRQAVLDIWNERHAGGMIRQSKTLTGLWSNILDSVTAFQWKIGNAGWFAQLKNKAAGFLETLNKWQDSGKIDEWAKRISGWLETATNRGMEFVQNVDWAGVANGMGAIVTTLMGIVSWIGKAHGAWTSFMNSVESYEIGMERNELKRENDRSKWFPEFMGGGRTTRAKNFRRSLELDDIEAHRTGQAPRQVRAKDNTGVARPKPIVGKQTSAVDLSQKLAISITTPAGIQASAKPVQVAPGTRLTVNRQMRGPAMAAAA